MKLHRQGGERLSREARADALRSLIAAGEQFRHAIADRYEVSESETMALTYLTLEGSLTQADLSTRMAYTRSSITALVDRLEVAGFAAREPHPTDRRKTIVVINDAGRTFLADAQTRLVAALDDVTDDTVTQLARIAGALNEQTRILRRTDSAPP